MPQDKQARWKVKPKGVATVRRGEWWVPKEPGGTPAGTTGGGGRGAVNRAARRRKINLLPPIEFQGSEGLRGPFVDTPRLNPDEWEVRQNPKTKRYFARPANELTGLDQWMRRDVLGFDRQTGAQIGQITGAYDAYATQAAADAAAGAANLGNLARAGSAGYADTTVGASAGPYGSVAPVGISQAERALPGVLAQGGREGSVAQSAQTIAGLNQLPTVARSEGLGAANAFRAERGGQRSELLQGYRGLQQEAAAAKADAAFKRQQLGATLQIALGEQANTRRGQTLTAETSRRGQELDFETAERDRAASLAKEAAKLRQQAQLAKENNRLERWKTLMKRAEAKDKEAKKARQKRVGNAKTREQADRLIDQMYAGVEDPDAPGGLIKFTLDDMIDALVEEFDFSPSLARRYASRGAGRAAGGFFGF